jgi:D-alanyl-D-alanine carboxypeptidase/D-alanyl-D-alanine-endopeptidase (penicillin-binding protein 4)
MPAMPCRVALALMLCCFVPWSPARAADELPDKINAVIEAPEYKHARWGILVVDAETGKTVYERNPDMLFAPASVTKLYSCAAALIEFGPDYTFETPVYRRGEVLEGKLHGDLILVSKGDFTLGGRTTADGKMAFKNQDHIYAAPLNLKTELTDTDPLAGLKALAKQIKEAGIRQFDGDVLIDDRLFARARGSGSGPDVLSPVVVNDNLVDVVITPAAKAGERATVQTQPRTEFEQIDVQVETVAEGAQTRIGVEHVGPERFVVRGQIALKAQPQVRICPVDDPAGFARALLIDVLREQGITARASGLRPPVAELPDKDAYKKLTRVAVYHSPPLSEALKVTLKVSHNLYASMLPLLLAVKHDRRTLPDGMQLEGEILAKLGLDVKEIALESGAGGGIADRVTPRMTVQLLQEMAKRPDWPVYKAALPVLGVDGTLADTVAADSPAKGKVFAKTGTYGDVDLLNQRTYLRSKSLAGVMTTASGRTLMIAMFVNDVPLPRGVTTAREGKQLGRLCEIIYEHAK